MIEAVLSQNLEDRRNDTPKNRYPTRSKAKQRGMNFDIENNRDEQNLSTDKLQKEKRKETRLSEVANEQVRALPYVDVPPLKPSLPPRTATPVKIDTPVKINQLPNIGPSYKNRAPVETGLDIEKLVESVLDLEIKVPLRSLAGASGAIQKEIRKQMTKSKQSVETGKGLVQSTDVEPKMKESYRKINEYMNVESLPVSAFMMMEEVCDDIPEGHLVASDPVVQYLLENKDANPSDLIIAKPSEPLRAIYASINQIGQEECLLDSGSMIISMAKETAVQLGLVWDPGIKINMESASNHLEQTLGLARNVCFRIGGMNLYLQVHILENPPYKVLLGRPFDAFTSSTVKTKLDGSSEVTLTDPNTKRMVTMSTYQRGIGPEELQKQKHQGF
jgi:hypothetical protein